ncbi:hypothetical protein MCAP1_003376 [Malassezia caprae]|uniref:Extradiol ring-cleavage dioxygenase class III enzyme subunit B domain-containing protein n=1 Tax=Malassezia caprae TaxID=1381934 RepID=A0AAF0EA44_9BASI|nr:hypothetical protein MCAP1_003376 [Malassezia caprae]
MNAIENTISTQAWAKLAQQFPKPRAIVVVSAHWVSIGLKVTASQRPETIHDFGGFPRELYEKQYPAPGEPALAQRIQCLLSPFHAQLDQHYGLDHGAWCVMTRMYPEADIPVVQVSLDAKRETAEHMAIARKLATLRDDNILLLASGNIVHNLRAFFLETKPSPWLHQFEDFVTEAIERGDVQALIAYKSHPDASKAAPDWDHFMPVLYAVGGRHEDEMPVIMKLEYFPGVSMTAFGYGLHS